jgi:PAS domain S-box-containing protein
MLPALIKVLLVEDDEDDYIITRDLFAEMHGNPFMLDWEKTFEAGLETLSLNQHDICLVDYRLGAQTGVDLLRAALERGCQAPIILLTGTGEHQVDVEAMQAGAVDYLIKAQLRSDSLERSIRYALQRKRAAALAASEQARLAGFGAEVGLALARRDSLDALLSGCTTAMARYLNAVLAQIWTFDPENKTFELRASAGPIRVRTRPLAELPEVRLELAPLAEGKPCLIKQLAHDQTLVDPEWVKREGLGSFAAYPLVLEDKLVGLMSLFTQHPLTEQILGEMGSVANGIALCIERKRSEEALDRSEVKYRSVVESIKEVIFQLDGFGNCVFVNPAWTAVTGFEVKSTFGTYFLKYIYQEDQPHNRHIFLKLIERELEYCRYETRFITQGGNVRWVEVYVQTTLDTQGAANGLSGTLTDITARKLAEVQIQKLAAFPQLSPNPVLEFALDGTLTYANDAARELVTLLGQQDLLGILPPHPEALIRECLATGQEKLGLAVSANDRILNWSFFPIAASQVVHCYGADVTEVQSLEAQLRHAQKLESVGQLAAGIAHDFNNILTVIEGHSESLLLRCGTDPATGGPLQQISLTAQRAAALTRQLLMFSRKQVIQTQVLELNAVLQNLTKMLRRLLGEDIALSAEYAPDLPHIEADVGMLEQAVMNLAVNSRDAIPRDGKLFIGTSAIEVDAVYAAQHADSRVGHFVCLTVTDTGCGMDRKTLDRVFEPFFTTKEVGKGTGLGLATVYGIVKQHLGWVEVTSQVGSGTTLKIYFPAAVRPAEAVSDTPVLPAPVPGGKETILLVEDEPVLREFVSDFLKGQPYRVLEAGSGTEALRVWDEFDGAIDLLLTDMVMPGGMSGCELASQLKKRHPGLKVIYSSGYSPGTLGRDFGQHDIFFLPKPYLPPQLAGTVRRCLDGNGKRPLEPVGA